MMGRGVDPEVGAGVDAAEVSAAGVGVGYRHVCVQMTGRRQRTIF